MSSFRRLNTLLLPGLISLATVACQHATVADDPISPNGRLLPVTIDYHADGTLAHLVYRSLFTYNSLGQLASVRDSVLMPSTVNRPTEPWVQFDYANDRLASITLPSFSTTIDSTGFVYGLRPARFELTYAGQTVNARFVIAGRAVNQLSFTVDADGYPLKRNVRYGQLFLDGQGHLDYVAESERSKTLSPSNFTEILDQKYDQNQNIFAHSKEMQVLAALLASINRSVSDNTGLVGLDNALTANNLLTRTLRNCTTWFGCQEGRQIGETQQINAFGFPTQRRAPVGAMGTFSYAITYRQVR